MGVQGFWKELEGGRGGGRRGIRESEKWVEIEGFFSRC